MRLITNLPSHPEYKRLMLHQAEQGVFLFLYNTQIDAPCVGDLWFEDLASAYECTAREFGISDQDWEIIPDPLPNCQDDFIHPVRVKGRDKGSPVWGRFETLENGEWIDYSP